VLRTSGETDVVACGQWDAELLDPVTLPKTSVRQPEICLTLIAKKEDKKLKEHILLLNRKGNKCMFILLAGNISLGIATPQLRD